MERREQQALTATHDLSLHEPKSPPPFPFKLPPVMPSLWIFFLFMFMSYIHPQPITTIHITTSSFLSNLSTPQYYEDDVVKTMDAISTLSCPPPFIPDPYYPTGTANPSACQAGCCLPCPQHYALYPVGALDTGFRITTLARVVSALLAFLLMLSYLFLPRKREHPALLILFSAISIFLFSASGFFALANPKVLQCADRYTQSTQMNNVLCGVQGALLVFGSHATAAWLAALILNLHLHTVWSSNALRHRYFFLHCICWGLPLALTATTVGLHAIRYEFGEMCLVRLDVANPLFFYPLAAVVFPAFLIHLWTVIVIARVSIQAARSQDVAPMTPAAALLSVAVMPARRRSSLGAAMAALRIQWRALALALFLVTAVIFFWLFYFFHVTQLRLVADNQDLLADWVLCLFSGGDQTACAQKIKEIIPDPNLMVTAEGFTSSMGIVFFGIFALQRQFFKDWSDMFKESIRARKRRRSVLNPNKRISGEDVRKGKEVLDSAIMSDTGSSCDAPGMNTIGGGDATVRNSKRKRQKRRMERRNALPQLRITGSTLTPTPKVSPGESPYNGSPCESLGSPGEADAMLECVRQHRAETRELLGRVRTNTRMGMADVALPTSPVELGMVYSREAKRSEYQLYF